MYLTLFISEIPVISGLSEQKIYVRAEVSVPEEYKNYPAEEASQYLRALSEVIAKHIEETNAV